MLFFMVTGQHPWNVANTPMMTQQIMKGSFTVPKTVSPDCKNIIDGLLRVNPKERLTLDELLNHRWFDLAGAYPFASPRSPRNLSDIVETCRDRRRYTDDEFQIMCPVPGGAVVQPDVVEECLTVFRCRSCGFEPRLLTDQRGRRRRFALPVQREQARDTGGSRPRLSQGAFPRQSFRRASEPPGKKDMK